MRESGMDHFDLSYTFSVTGLRFDNYRVRDFPCYKRFDEDSSCKRYQGGNEKNERGNATSGSAEQTRGFARRISGTLCLS